MPPAPRLRAHTCRTKAQRQAGIVFVNDRSVVIYGLPEGIAGEFALLDCGFTRVDRRPEAIAGDSARIAGEIEGIESEDESTDHGSESTDSVTGSTD